MAPGVDAATPRPTKPAATTTATAKKAKSPTAAAPTATIDRSTATPSPVPPTPTLTPVPTATPLAYRSAAADLGEIVWCLKVKAKTGAPSNRTTAFSPDAEAIHAVLPIARITRGTVITAQWTYNDTELRGFETTLTADADEEMVFAEFHLEREPDTLWPKGVYAVSITVNGELALTGEVRVKAKKPD